MQKSAGAGIPPADDESVGLALGGGLFLPVFLCRQKAHGFAFFHIVGEVSPGKMEEEPAVTVRIGIIVMYELHPVFKKCLKESGAFLIIEIFAPAQVIDPGIFLEHLHILVELILKDIPDNGFHLLQINLRDTLPEFRELIHPVEPAFASVPQPQRLLRGQIVISAVHVAHAKIKIPDRSAIQKRIALFFVKVKTVELVIRLDEKVLDNKHPRPGVHVEIVPHRFPGIRVDALFSVPLHKGSAPVGSSFRTIIGVPVFVSYRPGKQGLFCFAHIFGNILIFTN